MPSLKSIADHIKTINNELDKAEQDKYINLKKTLNLGGKV